MSPSTVPPAPNPRRPRWARLVIVTGVLALFGAAPPADAEIRFQSRNDFTLGSSPNAFTFVGPDASLLVVATAEGLAVFRREDGQLVRGPKARVGRGAVMLAAGPIGRGGAMQVAYAGRDAARITVANIDAQGVLGETEDIPLPALPRVARIAALGGAGAALFVATDDGLSVLTRGANDWERHEVAAPHLAPDFAVADLTADGRVDLVVADDSLNQLRVFRATGDGGFEAGATIPSVHAPRRIVPADVDADGRLDLLVLGDDGLSVHLAQPDGRFAPAQMILPAPHLTDVAAADLTGDRRVDLIAVDGNRAAVSVLIGGADGRFALGQSYLVGAGPQAVQLGDINGDGRLDALTLNQLGNSATLLRGRGDGRFDGVGCLIGTLGELTAVAVDDFDRDEHPDLAVASEDGGLVGIYLGRGDGSFRAMPPIAVGRQPRALTTGDFNQDDIPDLAVVNFGNDAVAILNGDGHGGFAPPRVVHVGVGPSAISIGSFSSDTSADLAVVNSLSDSVSVLYGDGHGQFPNVANFPVTARPSFMIVGDTNQDGHQDLVVGSEFSESVAILLGNGTALAAPATNKLSAIAKSSLAEDLDHDGEMDLINPDSSRGIVEVLPGSAPGKFDSPIQLPVGRDPYAVATGDFDRDGRIDIVVVHRATQVIAILLNQSTTRDVPPPGRHAGSRASEPHS